MIRPPGWDGASFSDRHDGDVLGSPAARADVSSRLGIGEDWSVVRQVHGGDVAHTTAPGDGGAADALWTSEPRLPLAVFTADCLGVVVLAPDAVGVAHVGWRGALAGVARRLRTEMSESGHRPLRAALGPRIGPCCFEVGPEVANEFGLGVVGETRWRTTSVDLPAVVEDQLDGLDLWVSDVCTLHDEDWFSHRGTGTPERMAAIGWLP